MNETDKEERWHDTIHGPLDKYWGQLIQSWNDYYTMTHKDFIREFFIKLVGTDYLLFARNYNHRMKSDIDSVPGLSDYLFADCGIRKKYYNIFLIDGGYRFTPASFEFSPYDDSRLNYRTYECQQYFHTRYPSKINNLTECGHFAFKRSFKYLIVDSGSNGYYTGLNQVVDRLTLVTQNIDHNMQELLNKIAIGFYRRVYKDGNVSEVIILQIRNFYIKYMYDSSQVHTNLPGLSIRMASWDHFCDSVYNDVRAMSNTFGRSLFIKCNTPLFDAESTKMFHFFEKLTHYDNKFVSDYVNHIADEDKPETMFYDQLILKFFLENPTLAAVHGFLNTTRPRSYRYDKDSDITVPGCYLNWLISSNHNSVRYDSYSTSDSYNLEIIERLPPYYDLLNKCLFDTYSDTFNEGWMINEDADQHTQRLNEMKLKNLSMNEVLANANLIRDRYFLTLKAKFEKGE